MSARRDTRRRRESKPVRLPADVVALLDRIRNHQKMRGMPYSGYPQLVREIALKELQRRGLEAGVGLPTPPKRPPEGSAPAAAPAPLQPARSVADDAAVRRGGIAPEAIGDILNRFRS